MIKILAQAEVNATVPDKFPVIVREGINEKGEKIRFYLNYSWEEQTVKVEEDFSVLLGKADENPKEVNLTSWDVCIVKMNPV